MKSIILHIEYLLQSHDCVILPGFGAFIVEHIPAHLNEEEGVFYPPFSEVSMNTAISHDDGVLATSISRAEKIKFEEARAEMQKMIATMHQRLQNDCELSLGSIGMIKIGEENTLQFIPRTSGVSNAANRGFRPVKLLPDNMSAEQLEKSGSQNEAISDPDIEYRPFSSKNYYIPINKIFAKTVASLVVVLAIAMTFLIPGRQLNENIVPASMNPIENLIVNQEENLVETPEVAPAPEEVFSEENGLEKNYLIVATFHTDNEADNFIDSRSGGQFKLSKIKGKNVWRVSAGKGDLTSLRNMLNSSEFRAAFSEAWIWSDQK